MLSIEQEEVSVQSHRQIAEEILGPISWTDEQKGFCRCPGEHEHTGKSAKSDCMVYMAGVATVFCFHNSCVQARQDVNRMLRRALASGGSDGESKMGKGELAQRQRDEKRRALVETRASMALSQILKKHAWDYRSIQSASPVVLSDCKPDLHWRFILQLFKPDDVVWIGNTYDSGRAEHQQHFRTASEWAAEEKISGQFTCPATFKNNSFSRSNENVLCRRFLVVESDVLNRDQVGAVFRWMSEEVGIPLRAVVDTAGKSLHGWFEFPKNAVYEELQIILPQLGCDPGMFRPSQPCRVPGALRGEKFQTLIYLSEKEAK